MSAVTFDFGQTLVDLDHDLLARRVAEVGADLDPRRSAVETPRAWEAYNEAKRAGLHGEQAWRTFMRALLERAGVSRGSERPSLLADQLSAWLWREQPHKNLWRKPIPGMFELAAELRASGIPLAIVSNSEGKLAELLVELGLRQLFGCVADSGALGFEKPDPRIFEWAARRLGVHTAEIVHVGDAWEADVRGALGVGARAVWFGQSDARGLSPRVVACSGAAELRKALRRWRIPPS